MHPERTISLIAWDLDNTLIDRDAALHLFFQHWLTRRFPGTDISAWMASIMAADRSGDTNRLAFCAAVLELCGLPNSGAAELWSELQAGLPRLVTLDPRVADLLDSLSPRHAMCIATNGGAALQRAKIHHAGLDRWFARDQVFVSAEIGAPKPERRFFDALLAATGVPAGEVLLVGDHLVNDIHGAAACGLQTCWVSLGRPHPDSAPPGDFTIAHAWELEAALTSPMALSAP